METKIIYASKQTSQINNPENGEWINNISQGIEVKKGSKVSIEGITINSIGVGSDIIEIPDSIKNYPYLTNRMVMNCGIYINHNHKFTCPLPLTTQTGVYTDITKNNYGYLDNTGMPEKDLIAVVGKNVSESMSGRRYYIGKLTQGNNSAEVAPPDMTDLDTIQIPGGQIPAVPLFNTIQTPTTTIVPAVPAVPAVPGVPEVPEVPEIPATPDSFDLQNSSFPNDGAVSLVSDFDIANNVIPLTLNGGAKQFTDDGGSGSDYSTSHFRHITFDAGAIGHNVWVNFIKYAFEASSYSHYDRLYITASDNLSDLSTSAGLLNDIKSPTLSPKLYQSSSTSVSSGLGNSYVSGNDGYGSGGGWVVPTESGETGTNDMKGNNNSSWLNTWYKINTRYVRFYFWSDGSSTNTGWEILVAPEIIIPGTPLIPAIPAIPAIPEIPEIPAIPETTTTTYVSTQVSVPFPIGLNNLAWNFLETNIPFGVNTGYDNPSSIAAAITEDFTSADIYPNNSIVGGNQIDSYAAANNASPTAGGWEQFTASTLNTSVYLINTKSNSLTNRGNSTYGAFVGYSNPFLMYYGSRLLSPAALKNASFIIDYGSANNPHNNDVINIFKQDLVAGASGIADTIPQGRVLTTNLVWNADNVRLLQQFLHSQKEYSGNSSSTENLNSQEQKSLFTTYIKIGRCDDGQANNTIPLMPPAYNQAANTLPNPANNRFATPTFYNELVYQDQVFPLDAYTTDAVFNNEQFLDLDGNLNLSPKQVSQYLDVNFVCVELMPPNSILPPGETRFNIGIVMKQTNQASTNVYNNFNYLIDLSFFNPANQSVLLINPNKYDNNVSPDNKNNYSGLMNVGSPNASMVFDGARGRFAFSNLSWALIGDNGDSSSALPGAGEEYIGINIQQTPAVFASGIIGTPTITPHLEYSQSGIGILNFSVIPNQDINKATTQGNLENFERIDFNIPQDIADKWDNSLMNRLGFTYNGVVNRFGLPDTIFNPRHINQVIPFEIPNNFPYPMTTNVRIDTSQDINLGVNSSALPMFDLRVEDDYINIKVAGETASLYAVNLPKKLEFPYWLVESDIINGVEFYSQNNGAKANILGICNRAYLSGDYAIGMGSDYVFTATKDYIITDITTHILNPDLTPAFIDDKTAVIYKIQSPLLQVDYNNAGGTLFPPPLPPKQKK